jgi:hypothetical protein
MLSPSTGSLFERARNRARRRHRLYAIGAVVMLVAGGGLAALMLRPSDDGRNADSAAVSAQHSQATAHEVALQRQRNALRAERLAARREQEALRRALLAGQRHP